MNSISKLLAVCFTVCFLTSCEHSEHSEVEKIRFQVEVKQIIKEVNQTGTITDQQAEKLAWRRHFYLKLEGLKSITNRQAEILSSVEHLHLTGLSTITDQQAEILSNVTVLSLAALTSITDKQVESLSKVRELNLNGLTSITDPQAEHLSKVKSLKLKAITSISDKQAESLSKVAYLLIPEHLQPLIDKYKKQ